MSSQAASKHARFTHLVARKANKTQILAEGGEQALSHSPKDIQRINFALERIENGQYGLCCQCGLPIDEARLDLIPETPLCAPCARDASK